MNTPPPRKLDLRDALILVMATAVGLALHQATAPRAALEEPTADRTVRCFIFQPSAVPGLVAAAWPFLVAWTLAFPILRLRRPRPGWRELARQPGMSACGIATLVFMALVLGISLESALTSWVGPVDATPATKPPLAAMLSALRSRASSVDFAAHAIAGAWLIMALGGWRRPERSGIDRLGRALGASWIAMMVAWVVAGFI